MQASADVVVIGAGIVGAACAYTLCQAGLQVHVVERYFPASGTSRACDGLVLAWDKASPAELSLARASAALWSELAQTLELDFEYARTGTLLVAENETGVAYGQARVEAMRAAGIQAEPLDAPALRKLEPHLAPDLPGGAFFPEDAQLDPRRATLALLAAARWRGLILHPHAEVTAISRSGNGDGQVTGVVTRAGSIAAETVVCAAGAWSSRLAGLVGLELPIRPRQGHILVTAKAPGLIRHPLLEGGYAATVQSAAEDLQVALVAEPTASGTLLVGSSRQFVGFDRRVSWPVMRAVAARAIRFLPALAGVGVIRSYAGLRPWSPDHLPLVGPVARVPGFYLAAGHEGAGIGLAPITGRLIADWILGTELPPVAAELRPERFGTPVRQADNKSSSNTH
jgi:glycine/D-amino acid oxidase-like deaminating enzyme